MAVGRIKVAGMTDALGRQRHAGPRRQPSTGSAASSAIRSTEVERGSRPDAAFGSRARASRLTGTVSAPAKDFVAWIYADPVGPEHNTLNCSISDLELDVELDGAPAGASPSRRAAAYEFGTRDTDHGIPLQPYPDG